MLKRMATAVGMVVAATAAAGAANYEWRFQAFWEGGTVNQQAFEAFARDVEKRSDGRIAIEALPGGAIVPSTELIDATAMGILHGMHAGGALHIGKDPAFAFVNDVPFGYESPRQFLSWFYEGGGMELAQELYAQHGVHYLGPVLWGAESIPTKEPIRTVESFDGVTMRSPEGIAAQIWNDIGVGVSTLPGSEVYTALETGRIQATDWGTLGMNDQLGFDRIARYAIYPGIHSMPAGDVAMDMDVWEDLPNDLKNVLEAAVRDFNANMLAANEALDEEAASERDPQTLIEWSDEQRARLREIAQDHWAAWAEKSPMAQRLYDSHVAYMTEKGLL